MSEKVDLKFDDFQKLDIRVGLVIEAEVVEGSDKLIRLLVDFSDFKRKVVTGMQAFFKPEDFLNKKFPFILNIEARKMMGIESHGILLAADKSDGAPGLIEIDTDIEKGAVIR